jgi:hypothetical protein
MTGIGGFNLPIPPASPGREEKSSKETLTPRAEKIRTFSPRSSPAPTFPRTTDATRVEAKKVRVQEKTEAAIIETLRDYQSPEGGVQIEIIEPKEETVQTVSSPRQDVDKKPSVRGEPKPTLESRIVETAPDRLQGFKDKLRFFENLSKADTPTSSAPTDPSPRRDATAIVPRMAPRESEKKKT